MQSHSCGISAVKENPHIERDARGRFTKGCNAGGKRRIPPDVKKMLVEATPDAVRLLTATINDEAAELKLRIQCAEIVLDRVYGKSPQPIMQFLPDNEDNSSGVIMLPPVCGGENNE